MTTSTPLLSIENLTVAFGQSRVVENLSFTVEAGQTVAVVGESGSGKSMTSLSIMRLTDNLEPISRAARSCSRAATLRRPRSARCARSAATRSR